MFVHLIKDYKKKLDAIEQRLEVSLDRDEVQTLGLKLRFYFNEVKHYQNLLKDVYSRIVDIQDKYGFVPEENQSPVAAVLDSSARQGDVNENAVALVSDWIARLEKQGIDPKILLQNTGAGVLKKTAGVSSVPGDAKRKTGVSPGSAADLYKKSRPEHDKEPVALDEKSDAETASGAEDPPKDREAVLSHDIITEETAAPDVPGAEIEDASGPDETSGALDSEAGAEDSELLELPPDGEDDSADRGSDTDRSAVELMLAVQSEDIETADGDAIPAPGAESDADVGAVLNGRVDSFQNGVSIADALSELEGYAATGSFSPEETALWFEETGAVLDDPGACGAAACFAAFLLKTAGRTGTAINALESALRKNPPETEPYRMLGDLYRERGLHTRAADCYRAARHAGDISGSLFSDILSSLENAGRWADLVSETEQFRDSDNIVMLLLRAEALHHAGRQEKAAESLELIAADAGDPSLRVRALIRLAKLREEKGDVLGAIEYYEKCSEVDPENQESRYELGRLYIAHKAVPLAKNELVTLIKRYPESEWADMARELMAREGIV